MGKLKGEPLLGAGSLAGSSRGSHYDADAISLNTTHEEDITKHGDLPSYSDSVADLGSSTVPGFISSDQPSGQGVRPENSYNDSERAALASHPGDQYNAHTTGGTDGWWSYRGGNPQTGRQTATRLDERLKDPDELYKYITEYVIMLPPHPSVRVHGWHRKRSTDSKGKSETKTVTDFNFTMDLQKYLRPPGDNRFWGAKVVSDTDHVHRGSWRKTVAAQNEQAIRLSTPEPEDSAANISEAGGPSKNLRQWCKDYCSNPAWLKTFRINRNVLGIDEAYLKTEIERLIRELNYVGRVDISFPVGEKHVDIYSPHIINEWRTSGVRWFFYLTFLWIITWPILFFMTKRWDVYNVNWLFSCPEWDSTVQDPHTNGTSFQRRFATISESEWYRTHWALIRRVVLTKFTGDATNMPLHVQNEPDVPNGFLPRIGHDTADSAIGVVNSTLGTWDAMRNGRGFPAHGWGHDC